MLLKELIYTVDLPEGVTVSMDNHDVKLSGPRGDLNRIFKHPLISLSEDNGKGGIFNISLNGRINGCGAIKPRFSVKLRDMERHEARYLPAKDFGILILTTPFGVMNNDSAKEALTGGKLLAYVY